MVAEKGAEMVLADAKAGSRGLGERPVHRGVGIRATAAKNAIVSGRTCSGSTGG